MAWSIYHVVCLVVFMLVAVVEATPPGIANHPSQATCNIKKYKHCYNLVHVCPKFCPDGCTVECASCKPICTDSTTPTPPDSESPPEAETPPQSSPPTYTPSPPSPSPPTESTPPPTTYTPSPPSPSTPPTTPPPTTPPTTPSPPTESSPPPTTYTPSPPSPSTPPTTPATTPTTSPSPPPTTPSPPTESTPPPTASTPPTSSLSPPPAIPPPTESTPPPTTTPPISPSPPPTTPPPTESTPPPTTSTPPSTSPSSPPTYPPPTESTPPPPTTSTPPATSPSAPLTTPPSPTPSSAAPTPLSSPTSRTPSSPSPPTSSPTPPSSSPPTRYPPSSSPPTWYPPPSHPKKAKCMNKKYRQCYASEHVCPASCPNQCEVDCVTCKPVCKCDMPGAVCQDPRFIGGDGITFYFHGKKDQDFCLVTDNNLHINGHFIGKRNENMARDFTWVQSIAVLFDNHKLLIGAQKTSSWDDTIDRLTLIFDEQPILLPETEGAKWQTQGVSPTTSITRIRDTNDVIVEVDGLFKITARVVPITKEESRIHNYGITEDDCFAHLDLKFKFFSLSEEVNGVLGQTYKSDYVSKVKMGVSMPVMGGDSKFSSSSLYAADCSVARFKSSHEGGSFINLQLPSLRCESGLDGQGVVCKR